MPAFSLVASEGSFPIQQSGNVKLGININSLAARFLLIYTQYVPLSRAVPA